MNIFEGSRRIALLVAGLAIVGTLFGLATYDPYVSVSYSISHPRASFQRMSGSCPTEAGRHYFTTASRSGKRVAVDLCLLTIFGENEEQLVPYKIDENNMAWGAAPYSIEVSEYESTLEARFSLPIQDEEWLDNEVATQYWKNWREGLGYLGIGLLAFAAFVWAVGWTVRGFMGIPRGMDKKPNGEA